MTELTTAQFDITIETPNLFALCKRVEAQAIAFETILHESRVVASVETTIMVESVGRAPRLSWSQDRQPERLAYNSS